MPLPTLSLRADPAHHALLRRIARRLRQDPDAAVRLAAALDELEPGGAGLGERLDILEGAVAALTERLASVGTGGGGGAAGRCGDVGGGADEIGCRCRVENMA